MNIGLKRGSYWWIEPLFVVAILAGVIRAVYLLWLNGYLPQPFFYDTSDSWMDWFNPAFWSHDTGTYDTWGTVYPPLSFVFLKFTSIPVCYIGTQGYESRACDIFSKFVLNGFVLLNAILVARIFYKHDKNTAFYRWFGVILGFPMLNAWERGNLILVAFTCFALFYGPLIKSARLRWLFAGLAVNFKVYMLTSICAYVLRRRWLAFEGCVLATIAIYIISWGIMGRGTPFEVYENIVSFSADFVVGSLLDLWAATTYQSVYALLNGLTTPVLAYAGSQRIEALSIFIDITTRGTQISILLAAFATWLRPEKVSNHRIINLLTCLALITTETGAYTQAILVFMTFFERWEGFARKTAIISCYILCIPYDIFIDPLITAIRPGFLDGPPVLFDFWITAGPFVRPAIVMLVPFLLSWLTIYTVWTDVRTQGWKNRLRTRFDLPLFNNGGKLPDPAEAKTA